MRPSLLAAALAATFAGGAKAATIDPARLPLIATISPRFQSYNIEMAEITGAKFWRPYSDGASATDRYSYQPPIDLANPRLRALATAFGPAYVRISGTWANTTWFADSEASAVPPGFEATVTPARWRAVASYLSATGGELVTSFAGSSGSRDAGGAWQPTQMERVVALSRTSGITLAAAEFLNEPNLVSATGAPPSYSAADYGRDFDRFAEAFRRAAPGALVLGPGSVGEGGAMEALAAAAKLKLLASADMLSASHAPVDAFSYHHYNGLSQRCATSGPLAVTQGEATDPDFLARSDRARATYAALRDRFAPGKPLWLTETAQAACGGSPWASTFADVPRYLDQLGRLARANVQVVMHNTLAIGDYALLDNRDFSPRPDYWAALLWARLMGERVLDLPAETPLLRSYAHCLKGTPGGVALLAVNLSSRPMRIAFRGAGRVYGLDGADGGAGAALNGASLKLGRDGTLPALPGRASEGRALVAPGGATFVALPHAEANACR